MNLFTYRGELYPDYLRHGNAMQFIAPTMAHFCVGRGLDIGAGRWPFPGSKPIDVSTGGEAMALPEGSWDFIFSSHCLEHLTDPIAALEHWHSRLRPGGTLALYLPHPDMVYWRPQHCRKHRHSWAPAQMAEILRDLGYTDVIYGERDLAWSFAVIGFRKQRRAMNTAMRDRILELYGAGILAKSALSIRGGAGVIERCMSGKGFRTALEIGTYRGVAAAEMSQYCQRVVTIDLKHGKLERMGETFDRRAFWDSLGVDNVELVLVEDDAEKRRVIKALDFDFAFVDGAHDQTVADDFDMVKKCGRVLFHDYDSRGRPELDYVWTFVNSLPKEQLKPMDIFALWEAK